MKGFFRSHPVLTWTAAAGFGLLAILVVAVALLDWNALRRPIARIISSKVGHPTVIDGNLTAHVWSWNPRFTAENLSIRNPDWPDRQLLMEVKKITVQVSLEHLLRGNLLLPTVELSAPVVNWERDAKGRANWDPQSGAAEPTNGSPHLPAVRRLLIGEGKIRVEDRIRKLTLNGTVLADERADTEDSSAFQFHCAGTLDGRTFKLDANGGPLINVDPDKPYAFTMDVGAGDIALTVQGTIPKPFDLAAYDAKFVLSGADLADAYYLTNLALPNTAKYRLSGTLKHSGDRFQIDDFRGAVGASDLMGKLSVVVDKSRPKLTADLTSRQFNIADLAPTLGTRLPAKPATAASEPPTGAAAPATAGSMRLLPDADLQVNRVRGMDADVVFKAQAVTSPKVPLKQVQFHLLLENGVLRLDPLSFTLPQGQFAGSVRINAAAAVPETDIDMTLENIDLSQFKSASATAPPLVGKMAGRIKLHGQGESVHKFASSADGSASVVIPHGQIRAVLAELTGINVARGLGLLLAKDQQQTELRCGVAAFEADEGHLNAKSIVMDTTDVLITGRGDVNLQNETLDLSLQGKPKKLRLLRLHSPISVAGTLSKPRFGIEPEKAILQAGAGTVLGTLLTPMAAVPALVNPGEECRLFGPDGTSGPRRFGCRWAVTPLGLQRV